MESAAPAASELPPCKPPISVANPPRFDLSSAQSKADFRRYLHEHGYAVVASVADEAEVHAARARFWAAAEMNPEHVLSCERADCDSLWWPNKNTGICSGAVFNHSEFCWATRLLPRVSDAFATVWEGDRDLIVSFDGGNAFRPWKMKKEWSTQGGWWHVDQGLVTYYDASADTGGLCVVPGSHRAHDDVCARAKSAKMGLDFVSVHADDPILSGGGVLVCAQAGDLLLWDSRTVHCNTPAPSQSHFFSLPEEEQRQQAAAQPRELIRLCSYVCMVPRAHATAEELRIKVKMFASRVPTSHWPTHTSALFDDDATFNAEQLPSRQRDLIGCPKSERSGCVLS